MPSLKLSNPFRRGADRPSLHDRAASLKATAGRVISGTKPDPKAVPDVPDARAFAVEQAALIDLSALSIMQLGVLFDRFDAASNTWTAELHLPYADERKGGFRLNTAAGDLIEREQERVAEIRDRIAAEIGRRQPTGPQDGDTQLETLVRHELMCNGDLRDPAIRARIEAAWGDALAHDAPAESVVRQPKPAADVSSLSVALAHDVIRYFGDDPIDPALDGDIALRDRARDLIRTAGLSPIAGPAHLPATATPAVLSNVEAALMALAEEYERFAWASDETEDREDKAERPISTNLAKALDKARHYTNQGRESTVLHAMALPATTLVGFGVKARILEHDAGAAWGEADGDRDIMRCRALLRGLIAAAGLSPIRQVEVTPEEIRGWLADPSTAPGAEIGAGA